MNVVKKVSNYNIYKIHSTTAQQLFAFNTSPKVAKVITFWLENLIYQKSNVHTEN